MFLKKKIVILMFSFILISLLSSCEVHYLDVSWQVNWYVIAIPVAIFSLICFLPVIYSIKKHQYKCPNCRNEIRPKFYNLCCRNGDYFLNVHLVKKSYCNPVEK